MGELWNWINSTFEYNECDKLRDRSSSTQESALPTQQTVSGLAAGFSWMSEALDQPERIDGSADHASSAVAWCDASGPALYGANAVSAVVKPGDLTRCPAAKPIAATAPSTASNPDCESDDGSSAPSQTFSPTSTISSASSVSEIDNENSSIQNHQANLRRGQHSSRAPLVNSLWPHGRPSEQSKNGAATKQPGISNHPRRRPVSSSWTQPSLIRQHEIRQQLVEKLVGMLDCPYQPLLK